MYRCIDVDSKFKFVLGNSENLMLKNTRGRRVVSGGGVRVRQSPKSQNIHNLVISSSSTSRRDDNEELRTDLAIRMMKRRTSLSLSPRITSLVCVDFRLYIVLNV